MRSLLSLSLLTLSVAACADAADRPDEVVTPEVSVDGTADLEVVMDDIFFVPSGAEVPAGTTLVVDLVNEGGIEHDLVWVEEGQGSDLVPPGSSETAELGPFDASARLICTVPGHEQAGMVFNVTVTG